MNGRYKMLRAQLTSNAHKAKKKYNKKHRMWNEAFIHLRDLHLGGKKL
jgi:hypothetical protein